MTTQEGRTSSPPTHEAEQNLEKLLKEFDQWAASADRRDDGWESDFPQWRELMRQAEQLMAQEHQRDQALLMLGRCWALSHEDETCAYWAREHIQDSHVRRLVFRLACSVNPETRWQAYDVLYDLQIFDGETQDVLEAGTKDENPYVRRRAFLVLLYHPETNVQFYIKQMLTDANAYNRYVAVKEGKRLGGESIQAQVEVALQDPEVAFLFSLVGLPPAAISLAYTSYYETQDELGN